MQCCMIQVNDVACVWSALVELPLCQEREHRDPFRVERAVAIIRPMTARLPR